MSEYGKSKLLEDDSGMTLQITDHLIANLSSSFVLFHPWIVFIL